ncbi:uncharacterized protein LOC142562797 isoform X2 [Dermacentor variabilis]
MVRGQYSVGWCNLLCQCHGTRAILCRLVQPSLPGDVETNPGPGDIAIEEQLKMIAKDIQEIKNEKLVTNKKLGAIDKKLEKIGKMEKQILECVERVDKLDYLVLSLTKKVDELDNRGRRSNLVIYGVKEIENESH